MLLIILTHINFQENERLFLLFPYWVEMAVPLLMIITGFLFSNNHRRTQESFKEQYRLKKIVIKWVRFLIPYLCVSVFEILIIIVFKVEDYSILQIIINLIVGGEGPGGYYVPVMLQVVLLLPLINCIINRNKSLGLILCFGINVFYEVIKKHNFYG